MRAEIKQKIHIQKLYDFISILSVHRAPNVWHSAVSGVARIDPLRFLAGCRNRRLNQAPSVLSLLA